MLTNLQKAYLKRLQRSAKISDADYRSIFPAVTGWEDCSSSTDDRLTNRHMDDLVARLRAIARPDDLAGQLRQERQPRMRREDRLVEIQACLGVYIPDVAGYMARVISDKFGVPGRGSLTLDDLSDHPRFVTRGGKLEERPSQLMMLIMTLWSRLQEHRRQAGHSLHDMRIAARVPCHCAACRKPVVNHASVRVVGQLVPADCPF